MRTSRIETTKNMVAFLLVVALGILLVVHFSLFWVYGGVFIHEYSKVVLVLETIMGVAILGFGVERLLALANREDKVRPLKPGIYTTKLDSVETSKNGISSITLSEVEKQGDSPNEPS